MIAEDAIEDRVDEKPERVVAVGYLNAIEGGGAVENDVFCDNEIVELIVIEEGKEECVLVGKSG